MKHELSWFEEIGKSPEELIDLELKQIEENMMLLKELKLQGMYCNFGKCTCDFCARFWELITSAELESKLFLLKTDQEELIEAKTKHFIDRVNIYFSICYA